MKEQELVHGVEHLSFHATEQTQLGCVRDETVLGGARLTLALFLLPIGGATVVDALIALLAG